MQIRIFKNETELACAAADIFEETITNKPNAVLGLATGASPVLTYKELIRRYEAGLISFKDVITFNLDEYCDLPRDDKNSYFTFMQENLFKKININPENVHIEDGNAEDFDAEAKAYDDKIAAAGYVDLQLLGIGTNGHIGFNEPADTFTEGTFRIRLSESTIRANSRYFTDSKMPEYALTMGVGSIMKAKKILLIATGEAKAEAIYNTVKGPVTPHCPASILQTHPDTVLLLDEAAAERL